MGIAGWLTKVHRLAVQPVLDSFSSGGNIQAFLTHDVGCAVIASVDGPKHSDPDLGELLGIRILLMRRGNLRQTHTVQTTRTASLSHTPT